MDIIDTNILNKERGIPVSADEPIYAISDFEGRYDYYIRFLMDIGLLDKEKLRAIVENNCKTKEEAEICNAFFNGDPEEFLIDIFLLKDENRERKCMPQNQKRLSWLIKHFKKNIIAQAINKDFKGKIVVNGDLYSNRLLLFLMNSSEYKSWPDDEKRTISCQEVENIIKNVNTSCYDLLQTVNNHLNNDEKKNMFLIAGNHDLYVSDIIKPMYEFVDCLERLKNNTLNKLQLLKFAKFKIENKTIVFKHSPHLNQDALDAIKREKYREIRDEAIRPHPKNFLNAKHLYYWKYANAADDKIVVDEKTIFCNDIKENENINKQLKENNYYMVFGHCGKTASNSSTYSIIDKDWDNYQYSKFSVDKNKQLKHEVYNAKNKITKTYNIPIFDFPQKHSLSHLNKVTIEQLCINKSIDRTKKNIELKKEQNINFSYNKNKKNNILEITNQENILFKKPTQNKREPLKHQRQITININGAGETSSLCDLTNCCNGLCDFK